MWPLSTCLKPNCGDSLMHWLINSLIKRLPQWWWPSFLCTLLWQSSLDTWQSGFVCSTTIKPEEWPSKHWRGLHSAWVLMFPGKISHSSSGEKTIHSTIQVSLIPSLPLQGSGYPDLTFFTAVFVTSLQPKSLTSWPSSLSFSPSHHYQECHSYQWCPRHIQGVIFVVVVVVIKLFSIALNALLKNQILRSNRIA